MASSVRPGRGGAVLLSALLLLLLPVRPVLGFEPPRQGEILPQLTFTAPSYSMDTKLLGLAPSASTFTLGSLPCAVALIQVVGKDCTRCLNQNPGLDTLYSWIRRGDDRGRICVFALGQGLVPEAADALRRDKVYGYPLVPDPDGTAGAMLGASTAPLTLVVSRKGLVLEVYPMVVDDMAALHSRLKKLAR